MLGIRVAAANMNPDFLPAMHLQPRVTGLAPDFRSRLARYWTQDGLVAHASIASFTRFCLYLMHYGAPAELLKAGQRAVLDETLHAQLAFGLAAQYGGRPVGPGPLPADGAFEQMALPQVLRRVVEEGCAGYVLAAAEAAEARAGCRDVAVADVLARIQTDKSNHADLAWRFLAWALSQDASLVTATALAVDRLKRIGAGSPCLSPGSDALLADPTSFGVLTDAARFKVRSEALCDGVIPRAEELIGPYLAAQAGPVLGHLRVVGGS